MIDWKNIKYFKPEEFNYPEKLMPELIERLDVFRALIGLPVIINKSTGLSDFRPKGSKYHNLDGKCHAIDFHVKHAGRSTDSVRLPNLLVKAMKAGFNGIGMYLDWNHPGLHCDIRDIPAYWIRINGKYYYI